MSYLVDTNIISEQGKRRPSEAVLSWLGEVPKAEKFVSVLTIGELTKGVEPLRGKQPTRASILDAWIANTIVEFGDRIVPVDLATAERWGRLDRSDPLPLVDSLIAATALVHGWIVATRNTRDFDRMGVLTYNPFGD